MYLLDAVFFLIRALLDLLWWAVQLAAIVQTLIAFNVLDTRNRVVWMIADFLYRVTEPLFSRIRRFLPALARARAWKAFSDVRPARGSRLCGQLSRCPCAGARAPDRCRVR